MFIEYADAGTLGSDEHGTMSDELSVQLDFPADLGEIDNI
jgi:hypothetical protein